MIKTAITGAGSPAGGELIRLLSLHPEVVLTDLYEPRLKGMKVRERHHGLIGETEAIFTDNIKLEDNDVLFVCEYNDEIGNLRQIHEKYPNLKIILFPGIAEDIDEEGLIYGIPEINRKSLVRGANYAQVADTFSLTSLVALFPFAKNLLLNSDISIKLKAPQDILDSNKTETVISNIKKVLSEIQKSFNSEITIDIEKIEEGRVANVLLSFECPLDTEHIMELYETYDDHNFTFATTSEITGSEVSGTDKCIISVRRNPESNILLDVFADYRLRGFAGDAVHIMNLMAGLHEKTGLSLKASDY